MRALTFARALEALQRAHRWSPDVACAIMAWRSHAAPAARAPPPPTGHRWRHARCVASSSAPTASLTAKAAASQPQLPLCEREAAHEAALSELLAWRDAARRQVEAVGDSWAQQDEGPSAEDLQASGPPCMGVGRRLRAGQGHRALIDVPAEQLVGWRATAMPGSHCSCSLASPLAHNCPPARPN